MATSICSGDDNGIFFSFKFPNDQGLSLRSVLIEDDCPKLVFDAANPQHCPSITQQDVAIVMRLVEKNTRPDFYFISIPPWHPFHGRQYKSYHPPWLRNTSVGDLLSEADWSMKCLHIGAKSDKNKEKFCAWQETSKLEDLATHLDFSKDKPSGSIIMSCKSVEVSESNNKLTFVTEPKMAITDQASSSYSDYITTHYDSVAYYDEPLFLKMKELIKLILAMEWLKKKKGVKFNKKWYMEQSQPTSSSQEIANLAEYFKETVMLSLPFSFDVMSPALGPVNISIENDEDDIIKFKFSVAENIIFLNPKQMLQLICTSGIPIIIPDVATWKELYAAETVPWPCICLHSESHPYVYAASGGVSTQSIPIRADVSNRAQCKVSQQTIKKEEVLVCSQSNSKQVNTTKLKVKDVPTKSQYKVPPKNVRNETPHANLGRACKAGGEKHTYGSSTTIHTIQQSLIKPPAVQKIQQTSPTNSGISTSIQPVPADIPQSLPGITNTPVTNKPQIPSLTDSGYSESSNCSLSNSNNVPIRNNIPHSLPGITNTGNTPVTNKPQIPSPTDSGYFESSNCFLSNSNNVSIPTPDLLSPTSSVSSVCSNTTIAGNDIRMDSAGGSDTETEN